MVIPASQQRIAVRELTDFCDRRIPLPDGDKKRLLHRWRGATVTLIEQRPWWTEGIPWVESAIAQFRFDPQRNEWTLYWRDRNQRWHPYEDSPRARNISRLLVEVDQDPTGIFWG